MKRYINLSVVGLMVVIVASAWFLINNSNEKVAVQPENNLARVVPPPSPDTSPAPFTTGKASDCFQSYRSGGDQSWNVHSNVPSTGSSNGYELKASCLKEGMEFDLTGVQMNQIHSNYSVGPMWENLLPPGWSVVEYELDTPSGGSIVTNMGAIFSKSIKILYKINTKISAVGVPSGTNLFLAWNKCYDFYDNPARVRSGLERRNAACNFTIRNQEDTYKVAASFLPNGSLIPYWLPSPSKQTLTELSKLYGPDYALIRLNYEITTTGFDSGNTKSLLEGYYSPINVAILGIARTIDTNPSNYSVYAFRKNIKTDFSIGSMAEKLAYLTNSGGGGKSFYEYGTNFRYYGWNGCPNGAATCSRFQTDNLTVKVKYSVTAKKPGESGASGSGASGSGASGGGRAVE